MKTFKNQSALTLTLMPGFGAFDANSLLNVELSTAEFATARTLISEGEFQYKTGKPKISGGEKDGKPWARLTLPLELADQNELSRIGVERIGARYETFLDLDENSMLATGVNQNINLGNLFSACGLYGQDATIAQLEGRNVIGLTKIAKGETSEYNTVSKVTAVD